MALSAKVREQVGHMKVSKDLGVMPGASCGPQGRGILLSRGRAHGGGVDHRVDEARHSPKLACWYTKNFGKY